LIQVAKYIKAIHEKGIQVAIVIGAGNIWRGKMSAQIGIESSTSDYIGKLGTIINSLALQSALENLSVQCRVLSAIEVRSVAEPYIRRRAIRHLEKNRVVIFAGGTGNPYFTTDTTASLRAMEINADAILMAKNGVDGVYTSDPLKDTHAKKIDVITFDDMLKKKLEVMDLTAVSLVKDKNIVIKVFDMNQPDSFLRVLEDDNYGTTIKKG
jgi:uridylate kinase